MSVAARPCAVLQKRKKTHLGAKILEYDGFGIEEGDRLDAREGDVLCCGEVWSKAKQMYAR